MKRIAIGLFGLMLLGACNRVDSKKLAQEVCDCMKFTNGLDPDRECFKLAKEALEKIGNDNDKKNEFTVIMRDCNRELRYDPANTPGQ